MKNPYPNIMTDEDYKAMRGRIRRQEIDESVREHTVKMKPIVEEAHRESRIREMERKANPVLGW